MIYVSRDLGFPTGTLGMIFALGGFGSLAGAWIVARLSPRIPVHRVLVAGLFVWAIGSAAAPLAASATLGGVLLLCTQQLVGELFGKTAGIKEALVLAFNPPAIFGLGNTGGFEFYLQNRGDGGTKVAAYLSEQKFI